jgi:hypothetical protein
MTSRTLATSVIAAGLALAGCGPVVYGFARADSPMAKDRIDPEVALYYEGDKAPSNPKVVDHVTRTETGDNCEIATIKAISFMQGRAKDREGNALVNLKAVWDGTPTSDATGYWCMEAKTLSGPAGAIGPKLWGVTWEADAAQVAAPRGPSKVVEEVPAAGSGESPSESTDKAPDKKPGDSNDNLF